MHIPIANAVNPAAATPPRPPAASPSSSKNLIPNTSPPTYLLNASTKNVAIAALANAPMARIPLGALYVNNVKITKTKNKNNVPINKSITIDPHYDNFIFNPHI